MAEAKSSILIVDDDSEDLSALEKALDSLGCKLHTVTDPHDVLPAVYREQPDVVILDALLARLVRVRPVQTNQDGWRAKKGPRS